MIKLKLIILFGFIFYLFSTPLCSAFEIDMVSTVTSVIDGDSFYIQGDEVRFADVSCPEWNEYGGPEATEALISIIEGKTVYLDTDQQSGRGPYGRLIAVVYIVLNETHYLNVNYFMLQAGYASLTDYSNNEFSPYSWNLVEPYGVSETASGKNEVDYLNQQISEMIDEYLQLYSEYNTLAEDYEALQKDFNDLNSTYHELETAYHELQSEKESSIPGFPVWAIIIGLTIFLIYRARIFFSN